MITTGPMPMPMMSGYGLRASGGVLALAWVGVMGGDIDRFMVTMDSGEPKQALIVRQVPMDAEGEREIGVAAVMRVGGVEAVVGAGVAAAEAVGGVEAVVGAGVAAVMAVGGVEAVMAAGGVEAVMAVGVAVADTVKRGPFEIYQYRLVFGN